MKVAITGASGLVGQALTKALEARGDQVLPLVRKPTDSEDKIYWSVKDGAIEAEKLRRADAVVHLAGEPIAGPRWTDAKKQRILESRALGTRLIAETLADLADGPRVLVSASAAGYYGDTREWVDENSPAGQGFLADVCTAWEAGARKAREAGLRVVHPRFGLILAPEGGLLATMLPAFKLGLAGPLGDGTQYFPWVVIDDVVRALLLALDDATLEGPMNVVAPNPVTNAKFTDTLGSVVHRPTFLRAPKFAIRAALGEMGDELLLSGQRVRPAVLEARNFDFVHDKLEPALRDLLG